VKKLTHEIKNEPTQAPLKHSRLGIAAFIISLVGWVPLALYLFDSLGWLRPSREIYDVPGLISDFQRSRFLLGISFLVSPTCGLGGTVLGIAGVFFKKNRKKTFMTLGLVFNVALITTLVAYLISILR